MIGLNCHPLRGLFDRHRRGARKDLRQGAFLVRVQVYHEQESHAGIGRQRLEQLRDRLQPAGRSAHADDEERWAIPTVHSRKRSRFNDWTNFGHESTCNRIALHDPPTKPRVTT